MGYTYTKAYTLCLLKSKLSWSLSILPVSADLIFYKKHKDEQRFARDADIQETFRRVPEKPVCSFTSQQ